MTARTRGWFRHKKILEKRKKKKRKNGKKIFAQNSCPATGHAQKDAPEKKNLQAKL
jgi:hypothetical protein